MTLDPIASTVTRKVYTDTIDNVQFTFIEHAGRISVLCNKDVVPRHVGNFDCWHTATTNLSNWLQQHLAAEKRSITAARRRHRQQYEPKYYRKR